MNTTLNNHAIATLKTIEEEGLIKTERILESPQDVEIRIAGQQLLSFCTNNYLGLANDPGLKKPLPTAWGGGGMAWHQYALLVEHKNNIRNSESTIAKFFGKEDAILYSSCFDANGGLFETLLGTDDVILSDALNHASIIDGTRLTKCDVVRYQHSDMDDLEKQLQASAAKKLRLIVTDGVFSMDGEIARLDEICTLAEKYDAAVMVDDSHGTGVLGASGRGSPEYTNTLSRIDILTSTLGKALGGASGGMTVANKSIIELLRQRSRPYLFSNTLPLLLLQVRSMFFGTSLSFFLRYIDFKQTLGYFEKKMTEQNFSIVPGIHPIVPIMLGDASQAQAMAKALLKHGIFVIGFWFPVVPRDKARIRVQLSAGHTEEQVLRAVQAFCDVRDELTTK